MRQYDGMNGWQRLFVVFACIWVFSTSGWYVHSRQNEADVYHAWSEDLLAYLVAQDTELKNHTVRSLRSAYADLSDQQLINAVLAKYLPKHPAYGYGFEQIERKYRGTIDPGGGSAVNWWWIAAILGVPVAVYLLGFAIAWVRAGFRAA